MTRLLRSLSNRIFLASAVVAVASILAAVWLTNRTVTAQAEREIARGLAEADTLVTEYRRLSLSQMTQAARLIADLPKFKAAVELDDPPTVAPLADDYRQQLEADLVLIVGRSGRVLAHSGADDIPVPVPPRGGIVPGQAPVVSFAPGSSGILQLVTVPVWIDPAAPDILGSLTVGIALDSTFAERVKRLTDSDIVFAWNGQARAGTLDASSAPAMSTFLKTRHDGRLTLGDDEYDAIVRPLSDDAGLGAGQTRGPDGPGTAIVLRSRTARLRPLRALHLALGIIAVAAVLAATLLSYFVARTVTRPVRLITATMREMAASGDLTPRVALAPSSRWGDEDAQVLASTFNTLTASIAGFQHEVAKREQLSALGRLSAVVAHEIRNPLMIIKTALRSLRRSGAAAPGVAAAVEDIDEEVVRLNRLVDDVLDFARPIRFNVSPASLTAICQDAVSACAVERGLSYQVRAEAATDQIVTDGERLRQALINVLTNAGQAATSAPASAARGQAAVVLRTESVDDHIRIHVCDNGTGVDASVAERVFDPFVTTKATGTGIGLAITRNIIEGLGGRISISSLAGAGTDVVIELPITGPPSGTTV